MEIQLSGISHCFEERLMLEDISIKVPSGSTLVVSGRSGCGKSLLFSIVSGTLEPDKGQVLVNGKSLFDLNEQQDLALRRELGVVFQVSALVSNLTLRENLLLPLNLYFPEHDKRTKQQKVQDICAEFGLSAYLDARTDELSTGLAAIAALARALMIEPQCLIWDAPLCEIDLTWSDYICKRLAYLKQAGTTLILFTNRERLIEQLADLQLTLTCEQQQGEVYRVFSGCQTRGTEHAS